MSLLSDGLKEYIRIRTAIATERARCAAIARRFDTECGLLSQWHTARRIADEIECGDDAERVRAYSDTRDPRLEHEMRGRDPIFRDHNCAHCNSGERACIRGNPRRCDWPRARND